MMILRNVIILICVCVVVGSKIVFPCSTPINETGYCISIFECPVLRKAIGSSNFSDVDYVKNSICRDRSLRDLMVCCPEASIVLNTTAGSTLENNTSTVNVSVTAVDKKAQREYALKHLLPTRRYCGLQHSDDRFHNDTETALDEFPWLVHVLFGEVEDGPDIEEFADRCSGVLINPRYVLTNGYCARNPSRVRLGQYNTNKSISCVEDAYIPECTEPIIEIRIEEQIHRIVDDEYYPWYEFALFRLAKAVIYTDFIRPICLPIRKPGEPDTFETLMVSGWGADDQEGVVKKRLSYNVTDIDECYKLKEDSPLLPVDSYIICLKPPENNTYLSCSGEEGGPLMYSYKHQWFVDSVIIQVYQDDEKLCSKDKPVDAIKITPPVIDWILETIRR